MGALDAASAAAAAIKGERTTRETDASCAATAAYNSRRGGAKSKKNPRAGIPGQRYIPTAANAFGVTETESARTGGKTRDCRRPFGSVPRVSLDGLRTRRDGTQRAHEQARQEEVGTGPLNGLCTSTNYCINYSNRTPSKT